MSARHKWNPLQRAVPKPPSDDLVTAAMSRMKLDRSEATAMLVRDAASTEIWINDLYQVQVRDCGGGGFHLNIRRRDGGPILRDWRHFQNIKNELLGPECEAIELYPAESRLVDTSNKFHLWGTRDSAFRFPIGYEARDVSYDSSETPGMRQRPL